jgi:hypothetical protein
MPGAEAGLFVAFGFPSLAFVLDLRLRAKGGKTKRKTKDQRRKRASAGLGIPLCAAGVLQLRCTKKQ